MSKKLLIILLLFIFSSCCCADVIDNLDNTAFLTPYLNSSVAANGNGTVSMTKTSSNDSYVNWRDYVSYNIRIDNSNSNDKVEITPFASINSGRYSLHIAYLNSAKQPLGELQWASERSDTNVQVLKSVLTLALENNLTNALYYYIRIRLHGDIKSGFIFDKIHTKQGTGYWKPTALTQAAPRTVFAHEVIWYKTPEHSGLWGGWNQGYKINEVNYYHYPWVLNADGRPDIASVYYPSVGYYDMKDPCLVEYHCQLMKMAGIGGITFDVAKYSGDMDAVNMMSNYLNIMAQYDLKAVVCYEDKSHWYTNGIERTIAVNRAYGDMNNWLALFINSGRQYYVSGTRPLFLFFSYPEDLDDNPDKQESALRASELALWLNTFSPENRPVIMRQMAQWYNDIEYANVLNGVYDWPLLYENYSYPPYVAYCSMSKNINDTLFNARDYGQSILKNGYGDFHISGVWPGFDDLAVWGWSGGPRLMPRYDGQLYDSTWDWAIDNNLPVVQIATWNDWPEATVIEPSVEFGNLYIEKTFTKAAQFNNLPPSPMPNFNIPIWIYKIRDITNHPYVTSELDDACEFIKQGQYDHAEEIVSYWADFFNIDSVTYWRPDTSLPAYLPGDYSHDNKVNFRDLVYIGQSWQNGCGIRDLAIIAHNWLDE
ncbi:MAG: hypothetical protein BWY69_00537 [Planctomycetes bacterium ADurb.Bin401]|nr:MAG: hypothetical protein BWY69_00537 [Planctomycetes bacterium ADurb.Bin401]